MAYRKYYVRPKSDDLVDDPPERRELFGKPTMFVFWLFVLAACAAVIIPTLPERKLLKEIQAELAETKQQEELMRKKSQRLEAEAKALRGNQAYLESRARDRLKYYDPTSGEEVIEMRR